MRTVLALMLALTIASFGACKKEKRVAQPPRGGGATAGQAGGEGATEQPAGAKSEGEPTKAEQPAQKDPKKAEATPGAGE